MDVVQSEAASRTRLLELDLPMCPTCRSEGGFLGRGLVRALSGVRAAR